MTPSKFLVIVTLAAAPSIAVSSPITLEFQGELTSVPAFLSGAFSVGDTFTERIIYESGTADVSPADPTFGFYGGALSTFEITIQGMTFAMDAAPFLNQITASFFTFSNGSHIDGIQFIGGGVTDGVIGPTLNNYHATSLSQDFVEVGFATPIFSSDALPTTLDYDLFTSNRTLSMRFRNTSNANDTALLVGRVSTGGVQPTGQVPEPASLALLGLGMAGLCSARRWKPS